MKIKKKFEPIASGISASIVISLLAYFTLETTAGIWLMFLLELLFFSFCPLRFRYSSTKNIFFGHLISILVGIIFNEFFGLSFYTLGLSVGIAVILMIYLKAMHPPAVQIRL